MNELPVIGFMPYTQRVLGWPGGKHLQVVVRKCMAESYSTSKKRLWREINAFYDTVFSEIDLGNVDTWQMEVFV